MTDTYKAVVKKLEQARYAAIITFNDIGYRDCGVWSSAEAARLGANAALARLEVKNGDWDSDHSMATYHYLHNN